MSNRNGAQEVERLMQRFGCLPSLVDGENLPHYTRETFVRSLGAAIEQAVQFHQPKLTIHMDVPDAVRLLADMRIL